LGFAADAQLVNAGTRVLRSDAFNLSVWPAHWLGGLSRRRRHLRARWNGAKNHQGGQQEGAGEVLHISL
jgi:hypothetical protein